MTGVNCGRLSRPAIVAALTAVLADVMTIVSIATDFWETIEYERLDRLDGVALNESIFNDVDGFYRLFTVKSDPSASVDGTSNSLPIGNKTVLLRSRHGGIWRICDRITGKQGGIW